MNFKKINPATSASVIIYTVAGIIVVAFVTIAIGNIMRVDGAKNEVKENCPRTDSVVLGGCNGTPSYVYDCTGIELKD